jgi:hypothetical protein
MFNAKSQESNHAKIVFAEALGSSDIYSLNFDYGLRENQTIMAGISYVPGTWQLQGLNDRGFIYIPVMYHYLLGNNTLKTELSAGSLQTIIIHKENPTLYKFRPQIGIGLRYQPKNGLFLRAGLCIKLPVTLSLDYNEIFVYQEPKSLFWPGFGFGYCFR